MSRQHLISGELNIVASEDGSGDGYWVTFVPRQRGHPPCDMRNERCFSARLGKAELAELYPLVWPKVVLEARASAGVVRHLYVLTAQLHNRLKSFENDPEA
jgi:hypothetical protein